MSRHVIMGKRRHVPLQVLFVGADSSKPGPAANDDGRVIADFEAAGWVVTYKEDSAAVLADANGKNGIFVSETVDSAVIGTLYKNVSIGYVVNEAFLWDDNDFVSGSISNVVATQYVPENTPHPMTDFDTGAQAVTTNDIYKATDTAFGPDVYFLAYENGDSTAKTYFKYDKGDVGDSSFVMPGRRVGIGINMDEFGIQLTVTGRLYIMLAMQWAMSVPLLGF